jgi:hypothetical protein
MVREYSDNLKDLVKGLKEIPLSNSAEGYAIGQKVLLIIQGQGHGVLGGRMPFRLRMGSVESRCATKKRKGDISPQKCNALRLRVTDSGEENSGLTKKSVVRGSSFLYDYIHSAYEVH